MGLILLMRAAVVILIFLALAAALGPVASSLQGALPLMERASCCQTMATKQDDCGKAGSKKSKQEQQCCATCAIGLAMVLANSATLPARPVGHQNFAVYISDKVARFERPPTPPPRTALS